MTHKSKHAVGLDTPAFLNQVPVLVILPVNPLAHHCRLFTQKRWINGPIPEDELQFIKDVLAAFKGILEGKDNETIALSEPKAKDFLLQYSVPCHPFRGCLRCK